MPDDVNLHNTRAHDLFVRMTNLEYDLSRLLMSTKDCEKRTDDIDRGRIQDLINYLDERRRFIREMQLRVIVTAIPAIKQHYDRLTVHTEESVRDIVASSEGEV